MKATVTICFITILLFIGVKSFAAAPKAPAQKAVAQESAIDPQSEPTPRISAEPWKGASRTQEFDVGGLIGMGIYGSDVGFSLLGTVAKKIINRGWVPDINDQVFVEAVLGPQFMPDDDAFIYSFRLRWDFGYDDFWTFYASGGLGGSVRSDSWRLFPELGVGALARVASAVAIRGEVSHRWLLVGVNFSF